MAKALQQGGTPFVRVGIVLIACLIAACAGIERQATQSAGAGAHGAAQSSAPSGSPPPLASTPAALPLATALEPPTGAGPTLAAVAEAPSALSVTTEEATVAEPTEPPAEREPIAARELSGAGSVEVLVRRGERMSDLVRRLVAAGLTTTEGANEAAANLRFPGLPFVPPPTPSLSRFEGLIRPGLYRFDAERLLPLEAAEDKEASAGGEPAMAGRGAPDGAPSESERAVENARRIFRSLIERGADRLLALTPSEGLSPYQQIVLASIVEKESVVGSDYGLLAGVFHNRLAAKGFLASCPTVEYALGYHRPYLTGADIRIDSPYNTYRRRGLPPTPIAFFSDEALAAAVAPPATSYYFFVFDWATGKHAFAVTYEEHERNVEAAYADWVARYGSAGLHELFADKYYEY